MGVGLVVGPGFDCTDKTADFIPAPLPQGSIAVDASMLFIIPVNRVRKHGVKVLVFYVFGEKLCKTFVDTHPAASFFRLKHFPTLLYGSISPGKAGDVSGLVGYTALSLKSVLYSEGSNPQDRHLQNL